MSGIWDGVFHLVFGRRGRAPPRAAVDLRNGTIAPPVNVEAAPDATWTRTPATPSPANTGASAPESGVHADVAPSQPAPVEAPTEPVVEAAPAPDVPDTTQPPSSEANEAAPADPVPTAPAPDEPAQDEPALAAPTDPVPTAPAPDEPTQDEPALAAPAPAEHGPAEDGASPLIHADLQLTPHFKLGEFIASATARTRGIDNTPSPEILESIKVAAAGMEKVRSLLGDNTIAISSGFRCPDLNRAVGGSATSDHMGGFSVDFRCDGFGPPYAIVERLMSVPELMVEVDQLIFEKSRWVHVSFAPRRKSEVLTAYEKPGEAKTYYAEGLKPLSGAYLA
jgi:zinc D-Ala-D-Ala carboxypeptidase